MKLVKKLSLNIALLIPIILGIQIFSSCGKDFPDPSKRIEINLIKQEVTLPSKISIFFKVDGKNNVPVAGLESDDFIILEKGENDENFDPISSSEANSKIVLDSQFFSFNTILILDLSGSVIDNNLEDLKSASVNFIDQFLRTQSSASIKMGVWWFDGEEELHRLIGLTSSTDSLKTAINSIESTITNDESTNLYGALIQAAKLADSTLYLDTISATSVVLFTDGKDQAGRHNKTEALESIENSSDKVSFLTIGLGDEIEKSILKKIGPNGSAFADEPKKLIEAFSEIANHIYNEANSYYYFTYCSPKRSGTQNKLRLEINGKSSSGKHKGSVETRFDATGFGGGCF
jgi:uncharacterized protein YegL